MSTENFIPTVWSARLLQNLNNAHVYAGLCNRDYEGEIAALGDTVKINAIGRVTIGNYAKNTDISDPETLTDAQTTLVIDRAKYFNFQVDDVDRAQQKPKVMDAAMQEAAWGLRDVVDQDLAALYSEAATANKLGSDASPYVFTGGSAKDPYDVLVDLGVVLDDNNVPADGRWVVVPNWYHGLLQKNNKFVAATAQGENRLMNGIIGRAAGFDVYKSNNVTKGGSGSDVYRMMAGHRLAWSYAQQILETNAYRPEKRFADAVKGLMVYGRKVVRPTCLAVCFAQKPG